MGAVVSVKDMLLCIMKKKHWSQEQLAQNLKFDKSQVSRWVQGRQQPRLETYMMLKTKYDEIQAG